jgi:hypothetical protein
LLQHFTDDKEAIQEKIHQLVQLDEERRNTFDHLVMSQERVKKTFDKRANSKCFKTGDIVLMWDKLKEKPDKHMKLDSLWRGPFIIESVAGTNYFYLSQLDGERLPLPMNGQILELYYLDGT